ncbi:MAG: exopolysaccharide biosynthesis polyprenyl glycosylphosphotransferase [Gaiellaceae bacterium]
MTVSDPAAVSGVGVLRGDRAALVSERTAELLRRRHGRSHFKRRGWIVRRALLAADLLGLTVAFVLAELAFGFSGGGNLDRAAEIGLFACALPVWVLAAKVYGLYERDEERTDHTTTDDFGGVFHMVTMGVWVVVIAQWLTRFAHLETHKLLLFWVIAIIAVASSRALARSLCRGHILYLQNTVVVGAGDVGRQVACKLLKHPEYALNLVGFVDTEPPDLAADSELEHIPFLGAPGELLTLVSWLDVERVIVAFPPLEESDTLDLVRSLNAAEVQVDIVPRLFDLVSPGLGIHTIEGLPLIGLPPSRLSRSSRLLKRGLDIVAASAALIALAPLFAWIAWRIKRDSPGSVFFRQQRMGAENRSFSILKFRTMVVDAEARKPEIAQLNVYSRNGGGATLFKVRDDPRVTPIGRFLRRYFLDELPQLLNVLRGEMSIVGPRPLVLDEDVHVGDWGRRRLSLKPGMTGAWQVLGASEVGFQEMLRLDYLYVSNWSLWGDVRLVCKTIPVVLRGEGGSG